MNVLTKFTSSKLLIHLCRSKQLNSNIFASSYKFYHQNINDKSDKFNSRPLVIATTIGFISSLTAYKLLTKSDVLADTSKDQPESDENDISSFGNEITGLTVYTKEDVSKHKSKENRIWVTYKSGVYDITDFVEVHPGGEVILLAAGDSIDPYWDVYQMHKCKNVLEMLEEYRIGNFKNDTQTDSGKEKTSDPWSNEPVRSPKLIVRSVKPFNAESPLDTLVESHTTPNDLFFVRNHLPVPIVDPVTYRLEIKGIGVEKPISLTLNELKTRFPKTSVTMTIQCAGNRRSEMDKVKPVKGLYWSKGAISTATWTGVKLTDLLDYYKIKVSPESIKHVHFVGLDKDPLKGNQYGASVPSFRTLDEKSDVVIAYEMNGQPIPRDHGYPVRAIIPGVVGARQVKWLSEIILSNEESQSHWQHADYKGFHPSIDATNADYNKSVAIQDYPVQSAICVPEDESSVKVESDGTILVKGYAWSGGGRGIIRVDVSPDDGKTWFEAQLIGKNDRSLYRNWAWTQWQVKVPVGKKTDQLKLVCKATDSSYCTQPESFEGIWNFRGVLSNAWNRIKVKCI